MGCERLVYCCVYVCVCVCVCHMVTEISEWGMDDNQVLPYNTQA